MKLGKIKRVELREVWKHEATNFTKWLAKPENLDLLSEEINIDLSLIDTEYSVGRFNVDIFAEESNSERKVIIENQLERTDHDHLGKLITYASGLQAEIIIWIVKEVLEEHQQAIDWLNENTDEKINFFAIRMEIWQIGNSIPAPKFHIVSQPNNWTKTVKQIITQKKLSETQISQKEFWDEFKNYVEEHKINLKLRKTKARHWYNISFGRSDCRLSLTVNSQKKQIACEVYIPNSPETYEEFLLNKENIEKELGELEWMELPNRKASRIKQLRKGDYLDQDKWLDYFKWLSDKALKFQKIFNNY